jgi:hypothetical protein
MRPGASTAPLTSPDVGGGCVDLGPVADPGEEPVLDQDGIGASTP